MRWEGPGRWRRRPFPVLRDGRGLLDGDAPGDRSESEAGDYQHRPESHGQRRDPESDNGCVQRRTDMTFTPIPGAQAQLWAREGDQFSLRRRLAPGYFGRVASTSLMNLHSSNKSSSTVQPRRTITALRDGIIATT